MPATVDPEPVAPRLVVAFSVAVLTGGVGALAALASRGAIGPGRLSDTGPQPGPLALALGIEVLVGLAILLLSPRFGAAADGVDDLGVAHDRRDEVPAFPFPSRERMPFDHDEHATGPAPTLSAPGTGIAHDVWPSAYRGPDDTEPSTAGDDEVRARIRAAWAEPDDDGRRR